MFASFTCLPLFFLIISARNWSISDITALVLDAADDLNARCVLFVQPSKSSAKQIQEKQTIITELATLNRGWHTLVGWTDFDQILEEKIYRRRKGRDDCIKPFYFILDHEFLQMDLEKASQFIYFTNAMWLMLMDTHLNPDYFLNIRVQVNSELYFANPMKMGQVMLFEVYAVGSTEKKVGEIGTWSPLEGLKFISGVYDLRRSNFRGQHLEAVSIENWPFTSFSHGQQHNRQLDGYFIKVWMDLEKKMNFSTTHIRPTVEMSGGEIEPGKFNGLLGMSQRKEIDVVLSELTMTPHRLQVVEFVQPLMRTKSQVYFLGRNFGIQWASVFKPFELNVWFAVLSAGFICSLVLYGINLKVNQQNIDSFPLKLQDAFFLIFQTFCAQATSKIPKNTAFRICLLVSYLTAAIIIPSYSAALISALTQKTEPKPFNSMEGILKTQTPLLVWRNTSNYEIFSKARNPLYRGLYQLVNINPEMKQLSNYKEMLNYICDKSSPAAIFGVETGMRSALKSLQDGGYRCRIQKFSQGVFSSYQSVAFPRNSPYVTFFNLNLHVLRETGLLHLYQTKYFPKWSNRQEEPDFQVGLADVASTFAIFLTGLLLSLLFLTLERIYCSKFNLETKNKLK